MFTRAIYLLVVLSLLFVAPAVAEEFVGKSDHPDLRNGGELSSKVVGNCNCALPYWYTPYIEVDGRRVPYDTISKECDNILQCENTKCEVTTGGGNGPYSFPCFSL